MSCETWAQPHEPSYYKPAPPWAHPQSQGRSPAVASLPPPRAEQDKGLVSETAWCPLRATEDWAPGLTAGEEPEWPPAGPDQTRSQPPASVTQPHSGRLHMTCRGRERRDPAADGRELARGAVHTSLESDSLLTSVKLHHVSTLSRTPRQGYVVQTAHFICTHSMSQERTSQARSFLQH